MQGVCVHGVFISREVREYNDKQYLSVLLACGTRSYQIGMQLDDLQKVNTLVMGDEVVIECRPFVNRSGQITFISGRVVSD